MPKYKVRVSIIADYEFEFESDCNEENAFLHASGLVQSKTMEELGADMFDGSYDIWGIEEVK